MHRSRWYGLILVYFLVFQFIFADNGALSDLQRSSYTYDIALSSLSELQSWAERLGISHSGTKENLQQRLYDHYDIVQRSLTLPSDVKDSEEMTIQIVHADTVTYSDVIILKGAVEIKLSHHDDKSTSYLIADNVVIDQQRKRVAAFGDASVKTDKEGIAKSYTADSFVFSYEGYEGFDGVLLHAVTRAVRENSDKDSVEFYLTGKKVIIDDDVMILDQSYFTSDIAESYYGLQAAKMKVLPDGDWFLYRAILKLGRVPILYFPAFYYPADRFFFNPAFGFDMTRGMFINTTTYIFGSKKLKADTDEDSFSTFMKVSSQKVTPFMRRNGAIMQYVPEASNSIEAWAEESDSYLSLQFDAYERSGFLVGVESSLHDLLGIDEVLFYGGAGYSEGGSLRYMVDSSMTIETKNVNISLQIPIYSDPDSKEMFRNRKAKFEIDNIFSGNVFTRTYSKVNNYTWLAKMDARWDIDYLDPYVDELQINNLDVLVNWGSYDESSDTYVIDSLESPNAQVQVSGTIFDFSIDSDPERSSAEEHTGPVAFELDDPFSRTTGEGVGREQELRDPIDSLLAATIEDPHPSDHIAYDPTESEQRKLFTSSLTYRISDELKNRLIYQDAARLYTDFEHTLSADFALSMGILDNMLTVDESIRPQYNVDNRIFQDPSSPGYENQSYQMTQDLHMKFSPLQLSYQYKSYLLQSDDNRDSVIKHTLSTVYSLDIFKSKWNLSTRFNLPPLEPAFTPNLSISIDPVKIGTKITYRYDEDSDTWSFSPMQLSAKVDLYGNSYGKIVVDYDHEKIDAAACEASLLLGLMDGLDLSGSAAMSLSDYHISDVKTKLTYKDASIALWYEYIPQNTPHFDQGLRLTAFKLDSGHITYAAKRWYDRIEMRAGIDTSWYLDFTDFRDNIWDVSFSFDLSIAEFIDISIRSVSKNTATYIYFPRFSEENDLGFFKDVLMSMNIFNNADRLASNFNLDSIQIGIVHYMQDWDLHADVDGKIGYNDKSSNWEWQPTVSVYVQWKAIPELDFETVIKRYQGSYDIITK